MSFSVLFSLYCLSPIGYSPIFLKVFFRYRFGFLNFGNCFSQFLKNLLPPNFLGWCYSFLSVYRYVKQYFTVFDPCFFSEMYEDL